MRRFVPARLPAAFALLACAAALPTAPAAAQAVQDAGQATTAPTSPSSDHRKEVAAVREARAAQRTFEFTRRLRLPPDDQRSEADRSTSYYGGDCPVRIGRLCWWDNNDEGSPPPEPASISAARTRLLDALTRAATADPANAWVTGQRVRYALEAHRPAAALAAATTCGGSASWCLGLRGVVFHLTNRAADAAAAFDSADALRTPAERCAWYDVSPWLESGQARAYHRLACGSEDQTRWNARFWRLAQPLWLLPVNDLRNEWNARRIMTQIHGEGANPYGMSWGDDFAECELRYGWPTGWTTRQPTGGIMSIYAYSGGADQNVVGHEPAPSYDFVPRHDALSAERHGVADVPADAWSLRPPSPTPMRYAPAYAGGGIGVPTYQLARFRRGDTAVVVTAFDTGRDSLWSDGSTPPTLSAGLFVLDDSGEAVAAERRDSVARTGVLLARIFTATDSVRTGQSEAHWLLGFEILQRDTVHTADGRRVLGRALRTRAPLQPLGADAQLSDLLLLRHSPGPTPTLSAALDSAAGSLDVRTGGTIGLYWEQYTDTLGTLKPIAPDTIVIAATRLTRTFRERLAGALGMVRVERPIALRYPDPGGTSVGRAIGLTWPDVPAGDYRLEVTLVPGTPGPGTPRPGTPRPGTPRPGTPRPGTPRPGTPRPGTPGRQPVTRALVVHLREN